MLYVVNVHFQRERGEPEFEKQSTRSSIFLSGNGISYGREIDRRMKSSHIGNQVRKGFKAKYNEC